MTLLVGISLAANVAINLVLVPSWRLRGAAVATLIAYVILVALMFGFGQRMLSYRVNLLTIAKMGAASAVMGLVVAYLQSMRLPIVVLVPTGFAIYMVLITAMRVVKVSELVVIWHAAAFWKG
jgi:O-antigen/teichoic acid export membrane protein